MKKQKGTISTLPHSISLSCQGGKSFLETFLAGFPFVLIDQNNLIINPVLAENAGLWPLYRRQGPPKWGRSRGAAVVQTISITSAYLTVMDVVFQ